MPMGGEQILASWAEAPALIRERVERLRDSGAAARPVVVGVTGPVGSGKSTLASLLGGSQLSTDRYLPDYDALAEHERDEPRHAALDMLAANLAALRRGEAAEAPIWSFHSHRREGVVRIEPAALVVCEGLFALREEVRPLLDLGVYVDAPPGVRWDRWEALERAGSRGWGVERARSYFEQVAEPTFQRYAPGYRGWADIVVLNDGAE
jgi:uridine kinase